MVSFRETTMSRSAIEKEILALEKRLGMGPEDDVPPACGPMAEDDAEVAPVADMEVPPSDDSDDDDEDDLGEEIAALEQEIQGCGSKKASHKYQGEVYDDADQELADLYNEINAEDQKVIEENLGDDSNFFGDGENQNVRTRRPTPEAALLPKKSSAAPAGKPAKASEEPVNVKVAKALLKLAAKINNPEEPHGRGGLWQDKDVVEMEMGVEDKGEDALDAVADSTEFKDSEFVYAKNLKEASARLDRVAGAIEKRGGNWKRLALRIDKIADAIDGERKQVVKRIAARKVAQRKAE
jgi:hypothetical protein